METGICIEDVVQTLIDLQLGHIGPSTIETHYKQQEARDQRHRRRGRQKSTYYHQQYDNNININNNNAFHSTSILVIDEDLLNSTFARLKNENSLFKHDQHVFDRNCLRIVNRR